MRTISTVGVSLLLLTGTCAPGAADPGPDTAQRLRQLQQATETLETTMRDLCRTADAGKLDKPRTVTFGADLPWLTPATITFTAATFDKGLDAAIARLRQYETERTRLLQAQTGTGGSSPLARLSLEDQLRRQEVQTVTRTGRVEVVNVLENYERAHKAALAKRDEQAAADIQRVAEERRIAETERRNREDAARTRNDLNARWQDELDQQTQKEIEDAVAWRQEHGPGAFFKNVFAGLVGGAVTSLTGGIASGVGSGIATVIMTGKQNPTPSLPVLQP